MPTPNNLPTLIAILRGVQPDEVTQIAAALIEEQITGIEVPLNSPDPFTSIETLARQFGDDCLCGAGTVLTVEATQRIQNCGARLSISPNTNPVVIQSAAALGLIPIPGVATPSEAFAALEAGAQALKLFPAASLPPTFIKQVSAVLPSKIPFYPVGGINTEAMATWMTAGAYGFGLATNLYQPGDTAAQVKDKARQIVNAFGAAKSTVGTPV